MFRFSLLCALVVGLGVTVWAFETKRMAKAQAPTRVIELKEISPPFVTTEFISSEEPATYRGTVTGIEVSVTTPYVLPGTSLVRCIAQINQKGDSIKVVAIEPRLQSVLESAWARGVEVEVTYVDTLHEKRLSRVQILDKPAAK
jgi:hypothetical protein